MYGGPGFFDASFRRLCPDSSRPDDSLLSEVVRVVQQRAQVQEGILASGTNALQPPVGPAMLDSEVLFRINSGGLPGPVVIRVGA